MLRATTSKSNSSTHIARMVSAERELKEQAEAETYWELQRAKSLGAQLQVMREDLDNEEDAYWALRRQQSFVEALRTDWGGVETAGTAGTGGIADHTAASNVASAGPQQNPVGGPLPVGACEKSGDSTLPYQHGAHSRV